VNVEPVNVEAVTSLRTALAARSGVADAVRRVFHEDPQFAYTLLAAVVAQRFGTGHDVRQVTALTARIRSTQPGFPAREAEQMIRWILGEARFSPEVDWGAVNYTEAFIAVLSRLFLEWQPADTAVTDMLGSTAETKSRAESVTRDLAPLVRDMFGAWYRTGTPEPLSAVVADFSAVAGRPDAAFDLRFLDPTLAVVQGLDALGKGQSEEALKAFDRAVVMGPGSFWAAIGRAELLSAAGRSEQAVDEYRRAQVLDPDSTWAARGLGRVLCELRLYDEALVSFNRAIELSPAISEIFDERAAAYEAVGQHDRALSDYSLALELDPVNRWALVRRADLYLKRGQHELAVSDYDRAIDLDPHDHRTFVNRGVANIGLGRNADTRSDFRRAAALEPAVEASLSDMLGHRLDDLEAERRVVAPSLGLSQADADESLAVFTRILEENPGETDALACRGYLYNSLGRYDEALADLTRAVGLDPGHFMAACSQADSLRHLKRYDEALAGYNRASTLDAGSSAPYSGRAAVRLLQERYDEALTEFSVAIQLDPLDPVLHGNRAITCTALGRYEDTLINLQRAAELDHPDRHWLLTARAEAYRFLARYDEALADYDLAIELDGTDSEALVGRGLTYRAIGWEEKAQRDLRRAAEVD
jgi:tetratricopeptide (TPR) repeat protein